MIVTIDHGDGVFEVHQDVKDIITEKGFVSWKLNLVTYDLKIKNLVIENSNYQKVDIQVWDDRGNVVYHKKEIKNEKVNLSDSV
jgi:hypothetical protein